MVRLGEGLEVKYDEDGAPRLDYVPHGAAEELFYCRATEVLLDGPAGTGKTLAVACYLHLIAESFDGCKILVVRKTRVDLSESWMRTFEEKCLPSDHPFVREGRNRETRKRYTYGNRSEIRLGGLDRATRLFSTEYDIIYVNEAQELTLDDWEQLLRANRNGVVPWNQLIGDCNPAEESHWLNQRCTDLDPENGKTHRLKSWIQDNPLYYDRAKREYTARGKRYVFGNLGGLTGVRRKRLVEGLWVSTVGQIWPNFSHDKHVVSAQVVEHDGRFWIRLNHRATCFTDEQGCKCHIGRFGKEEIAVAGFFGARDRGFALDHAGVLQVWAQDDDGRCFMVAEWHHSGKGVEWWAEKAAWAYKFYNRPLCPFARIVSDPADPEGIVKLNEFIRDAGGPAITAKANNEVKAGLDVARFALDCDPKDGLPKAFFLADALQHVPDEERADAKLPVRTVAEIGSYLFRVDMKGVTLDEPAKKDDDGCDTFRYAMMYAHRKNFGVAQVDPIHNHELEYGFITGMRWTGQGWVLPDNRMGQT